MSSILCLIVTFLSFTSQAVETPAVMSLVPPATGSYSFNTGDAKTTISLQPDSGITATAMILSKNLLPTPVASKLKFPWYLHFTSGSANQDAPFLVITANTTQRINTRTFIKLAPAPVAGETLPSGAIYLSLAANESTPNEQRLKGTYLSQSGGLTVTPVGKTASERITTPLGVASFNRQNMRLEFEAKLLSPFNTLEVPLEGNVTASVLWPKDANSNRILKELSANSPSLSFQLNEPTGLQEHKRELAGSTKTEKAKK